MVTDGCDENDDKGGGDTPIDDGATAMATVTSSGISGEEGKAWTQRGGEWNAATSLWTVDKLDILIKRWSIQEMLSKINVGNHAIVGHHYEDDIILSLSRT